MSRKTVLLFVRKDGYGISAIYANTEGCTIGGTTLELRVEAGAYFKKGNVLTSTNGYQFIYDGIITKGVMGCICGMSSFGDIGFDYKLWTDVYDEGKKHGKGHISIRGMVTICVGRQRKNFYRLLKV